MPMSGGAAPNYDEAAVVPYTLPDVLAGPGRKPAAGAGSTPPAFTAMTGGPIDWKVENGTLVVTTTKGHANHIVSKERFQDAAIHAEFMVDPAGHGPRPL